MPFLGVAGAQGEQRPPSISTEGRGTVTVQPDAVRVHFGVMTQAKQLPDAREQNAQIARAVLESLKDLGLPNVATKSAGTEVTIVWPDDREVERQLPNALGYRITNEFTARVTSDSPDELGAAATQIVDAAIGAGANILGSVEFFKQDLTEAHRQALSKAAAAARANAEALAEGLGVRLLEVIQVSGSPRYSVTMYNQMGQRQMDDMETSTPFVAGEVVISCDVSLTAEFVGR
jgi:uncharacterized protein YggE